MTIVRLVALQAINLGHRIAQQGETVLTVTGAKADLDWFRRNLKWSALQHVAESEVEPEPGSLTVAEVESPVPPVDTAPVVPPVEPDDSDDADDIEDEESDDDEAGEPATDTKAPAKRGRPGKQHRR